VLDTLRTHQTERVAAVFVTICLPVIFVPGGLTGYYQPMDVGINGPLKHWIREVNACRQESQSMSPTDRQRLTVETLLICWERLDYQCVVNSFNHMLIKVEV